MKIIRQPKIYKQMKTIFTITCLLFCFYCKGQDTAISNYLHNKSVVLYDSLYALKNTANIKYNHTLLATQKRVQTPKINLDGYAVSYPVSKPYFETIQGGYNPSSLTEVAIIATAMFVHHKFFAKKRKR